MVSLLLAIIYICFISLGLPDSLLGSAWPTLYAELGVPISYAGIISAIISIGTITSSLLSARIVKKWGAGKITAISIFLTAVALFGFSISNKFWMLVLWAIPYGLGAGGVDSALNNYVALHYKSQHMSWLHCCWGVGASISPYIMSFALMRLSDWSKGYLIVSIIQICLSTVVFLTLPIWKKAISQNSQNEKSTTENVETVALTASQIVKVRGAVACFITFFCYCALESTASLWASTYLVKSRAVNEVTASAFASLFYIGITVGRSINGFLSMKFSDRFLIRLGLGIIALGIIFIILPLNYYFALAGLIIVGLGCAPVYPCIIHMTPNIFGRDKSQSMIGVQMASAYLGSLLMPPLFGFIANAISVSLFPIYLTLLLTLMFFMHERVVKNS